MYLSKVTYPPSATRLMVSTLRQGLYQEHKVIWSLFPDNPDAARDFLYARSESNQLPFYYVLSKRLPVESETGLQITSKVYKPMLQNGDLVQFQLRANAVITTKHNDTSKRRIRRDIVEARVDYYKRQFPDPNDRPGSSAIAFEAASEWLHRQAERGGFDLCRLTVSNHVFNSMKKQGVKNRVTFTSLDYEGVIRVVDADVFTNAVLLKGLGRSKAFGCGLMLVRRV